MLDFRITAFETKLNFVPVNSFKRFLVGKRGKKKNLAFRRQMAAGVCRNCNENIFWEKRLCRLIRLGIVLWPENPCLQSYVEPILLIRKLVPSATFGLYGTSKPLSFPNISRNQHLFNFKLARSRDVPSREVEK